MDKCPLTGVEVSISNSNSGIDTVHYGTTQLGLVKFTMTAFSIAYNIDQNHKWILAGMCRNQLLKNESPILIDQKLLKEIEKQDLPYKFEEKVRHLLKFLYNNGGKEYHVFNLNSGDDCSICYCSPEEFSRIMSSLKSKNIIDWHEIITTNTTNFYQDVSMTTFGIAEAEKDLPKIPMIGLITQKIATGHHKTDEDIEHARVLFFSEHTTFENKKSACVKLAYVLEPLKRELKLIFNGDTEKFFTIVNEFDIKHNKEGILRIQYEEQLEWIYFSLLNTISTYIKIKSRPENQNQ